MLFFRTIAVFGVLAISNVFCQNNFERYGCQFEDENFGLENQKEPLVWGKEIQPLELKSKDDLNDLINVVHSVRSNIYDNFLLNDSDLLIKFYQDNKDEDEKIREHNAQIKDSSGKRKLTVEDIEEKISPDYHNRQDNFGLVLKALEMLSAEARWNLRDHCYVAFAGVGVKRSRMKIFKNSIAGEAPKNVRDFEHVTVIGIIKVIIGDRLGYVLVDMESAVTPTPYVMIDDLPPEVVCDKESLMNCKYRTFGNAMTFKPIGKAKTYIEVKKYTEKFHLENRTIIYIDKPVCSYKTITSSLYYSLKVRTIAKISSDFQRKAFVFTRLDESLGDMFSVAYETYDVREKQLMMNRKDPVSVSLKTIINLSKEDETVVQNVADALNLPNLKTKMTNLGEVANIYRAAHSKINTPCLPMYIIHLMKKIAKNQKGRVSKLESKMKKEFAKCFKEDDVFVLYD